MNSREEVFGIVVKWAEMKKEVCSAWLFGSRAKGSDELDSDWDVAIQINLGTPAENRCFWFEVIDLWRSELLALSNGSIDLQLNNPPETPNVSSDVEAYGIKIL